jgi:hypothetical protein
VNAEPVLNSTTGEYEFSFEIPYRLRAMDIATEDDPPEVREDPTVVFSVEPHDTFYLRFTTDLLSETADLGYPEELLEELNTGYTLDPAEVAQVEQFTYSDVNTGNKAGFLAIRLINALSTGGFQIQSGDKAKGQFAFEFTSHFSMDAQDTVPFEIYVSAGVPAST